MFKFQPEDFIVEEIIKSGEVLGLEKPFVKANEQLRDRNHFFSRFVLQKRLWTTANAIREIAERLHVNLKRINFAGNKDRNALTVQLCSAFAIEPQKLLSLNVKDVKILGAWLSNEKVRLGELAGNRFTINLGGGNIGTKEFGKLGAEKIRQKLEKSGYAMPNSFGEQRFGSARKNTAKVGKLLLQAKFREAIMEYLCGTDENESDERAQEARKRLKGEMKYHEALQYFPYFLNVERRLLSHLAERPNDHLGAFRKLHRSLQLLFIHAYQSELFNRLQQMRMKRKKLMKAEVGDNYCGMDAHGFPDLESRKAIGSKDQAKGVQALIDAGKAVLLGKIIGFQTELSSEEESVLEKEGIQKEDFVMRSTPELSSRGGFRPLFVFMKDFECEEFKQGEEKRIRLKFSLPSGSYATVALKEIIN